MSTRALGQVMIILAAMTLLRCTGTGGSDQPDAGADSSSDGGRLDGGSASDAGSCVGPGEPALGCRPGISASGVLFGQVSPIRTARLVFESGCGTAYPDGGLACGPTGIDLAMADADVCVVPPPGDFVSLEVHLFSLDAGVHPLHDQVTAKFAQGLGGAVSIHPAASGSVRLDGCDLAASRCWGAFDFADDAGDSLDGAFDASTCP